MSLHKTKQLYYTEVFAMITDSDAPVFYAHYFFEYYYFHLHYNKRNDKEREWSTC